jgi:hypothetical protein
MAARKLLDRLETARGKALLETLGAGRHAANELHEIWRDALAHVE